MRGMKNDLYTGDQRLLWLTDPHLEKASIATSKKLIRRLEAKDYDIAVITGDIARAVTLPTILPIIAEACGVRKLFVVLGNHDFKGADVQETLSVVDDTCRRHANLTHLSTSAPIRISTHTTLVGHHGLSGFSQRRNQDTKESCAKIKHGIFYARKLRAQLLIATHYPPFYTSTLFNSRVCAMSRQADFTNYGLGYMLIKLAKKFEDLSIQVIAGHTHHAAEDVILHNLKCRVGKAGPGHTGEQGIIMV